jgi:hypothetical protein
MVILGSLLGRLRFGVQQEKTLCCCLRKRLSGVVFRNRYSLTRERSLSLVEVELQCLQGIVVSWELSISLPRAQAYHNSQDRSIPQSIRGGVSPVQAALELHTLPQLHKTPRRAKVFNSCRNIPQRQSVAHFLDRAFRVFGKSLNLERLS